MNHTYISPAQRQITASYINEMIEPYYDLPTDTSIAECASMMHIIEPIEPKIDFGWQTVFFEALQDGNETEMVNAIGNIADFGQLDEAIVLYKDWKSVQPVC